MFLFVRYQHVQHNFVFWCTDVIEGADRFDSTSVASLPPTKVPTEQDAQSLKGLVVGLPREFQVKELSTEMQQTWQQGIDWLKQAGAKVVWVDLPLTKLALPTYYLIAPAEASSNLARYDGLRFGMTCFFELFFHLY
jgi:aspartyl-tRNA(Asn)/glutamyl-tRNA(Gln) amidotransferase subunit A